jgi:hypothetical protein
MPDKPSGLVHGRTRLHMTTFVLYYHAYFVRSTIDIMKIGIFAVFRHDKIGNYIPDSRARLAPILCERQASLTCRAGETLTPRIHYRLPPAIPITHWLRSLSFSALTANVPAQVAPRAHAHAHHPDGWRDRTPAPCAPRRGGSARGRARSAVAPRR